MCVTGSRSEPFAGWWPKGNATSGGLSCGIDLALHVVERYYGRQVAENPALWLEYQAEGWKDFSGASNAAYAKRNTQCRGVLSVAENPSICKIRKFHDLRTCAWMVLKVVDGGCYDQVTFVSYS